MKLTLENQRSAQAILADDLPEGLPPASEGLNKLFHGDNLLALKAMLYRYGYRGKIDLIYVDPPFSTKTVFKVEEGRSNTISMPRGGAVAYSDTLCGDAFLEFLRERLIVAKELLSPIGAIYLHIDYKVGHYVKVVMDEIFGAGHFRNDITRVKCNPKNFSRKGYGNIKDLILFYTKNDEMIWNQPYTPYSEGDIERLFPKKDAEGRRYTTVPIHAPGETRDGVTSLPFKGIKPPAGRHWRCAPSTLEELDRQGLIEWSKTNNPRQVIYADERVGKGKMMQDIWEYKDSPYPDYPTEKNLDMLEKIIETSSNEGSTVLDFFCGSGTTLLAAQKLGRKWVGVDMSERAISVSQKKVSEAIGMVGPGMEVIDLASAQAN